MIFTLSPSRLQFVALCLPGRLHRALHLPWRRVMRAYPSLGSSPMAAALHVALLCCSAAARPIHFGCPTNTAANAAAVVQCVQKLRGEAASGDALRLVGIRGRANRGAPGDSVQQLQRLLGQHGILTALDLQLVAGKEAEELVDELRAFGASIGDRAKLRLLLGEHDGRVRRAQNQVSWLYHSAESAA
eukprot:SAG31_NODE_8652_length_1413_cov_1.341705_2_plen_188_part_00